MSKSLVIETQCLPPTSLFNVLTDTPILILEKHENYQKRSFRNRVYIAGPNGTELLTIPLSSGKNKQLEITKVCISYEEDWPRQWLRQIKNAYSNSPYYIYYIDAIKIILTRKYQYLWEFNHALLNWVIEVIDLEIKIAETSCYKRQTEDNVADFRNRFTPSTSFWQLPATIYNQVYEEKHGFLSNLSVLDMIMCTGPEAKNYL